MKVSQTLPVNHQCPNVVEVSSSTNPVLNDSDYQLNFQPEMSFAESNSSIVSLTTEPFVTSTDSSPEHRASEGRPTYMPKSTDEVAKSNSTFSWNITLL